MHSPLTMRFDTTLQFCRGWDRKPRNLKGKSSETEWFRQCVLRLWPAFHSTALAGGPKHREKRSKERVEWLRSMADGEEDKQLQKVKEQELLEPFNIKEAALAS